MLSQVVTYECYIIGMLWSGPKSVFRKVYSSEDVKHETRSPVEMAMRLIDAGKGLGDFRCVTDSQIIKVDVAECETRLEKDNSLVTVRTTIRKVLKEWENPESGETYLVGMGEF